MQTFGPRPASARSDACSHEAEQPRHEAGGVDTFEIVSIRIAAARLGGRSA